jgi:hypothetical protein
MMRLPIQFSKDVTLLLYILISIFLDSDIGNGQTNSQEEVKLFLVDKINSWCGKGSFHEARIQGVH